MECNCNGAEAWVAPGGYEGQLCPCPSSLVLIPSPALRRNVGFARPVWEIREGQEGSDPSKSMRDLCKVFVGPLDWSHKNSIIVNCVSESPI